MEGLGMKHATQYVTVLDAVQDLDLVLFSGLPIFVLWFAFRYMEAEDR